MRIQTDCLGLGNTPYDCLFNVSTGLVVAPTTTNIHDDGINATHDYFNQLELEHEYILYYKEKGCGWSADTITLPHIHQIRGTHDSTLSDPVYTFTTNTIGNQTHDVNFTLTITAVNNMGATVDFNGTCFLQYIKNPLAPNLVSPIFVQFTHGIFTGEVKILEPLSHIFITIFGASVSGTSNYFDIS